MPYKDKEQQKAYQRQWMFNRRTEWFTNKFCIKCGSQENLELDHIDESAKNTHRIWSWSKTRRDIELAKCQFLCENCHAEKTSKFLSRPISHGTKTGYGRGCRCVKCHQALLDYWRNRRNKNDVA